jgi:hypothetical protein
MTTNNPTDVGPAAAAPPWCLPDVEPLWDRLTAEHGGHMICTWTREFGGVWIEAEDKVVDGRVLRSAPRIQMSQPGAQGVDPGQARELARALMSAANVLDES